MDKYLKIYRFPKNHQFANQTFIQKFEEKIMDGDPGFDVEEGPAMMEGEGPENPSAVLEGREGADLG